MVNHSWYLIVGAATTWACCLALPECACAEQPLSAQAAPAAAAPTSGGEATADQLLTAAKRGLALSRQAGRNWHENQTCFSCHHQSLPMLAEVEAARAGFQADAECLKSQADFTHAYMHDHLDLMRAGRHLPGGSATACFALWALLLDQRESDETTEVTVEFLLMMQGKSRGSSSKSAEKEKSVATPPRGDGPWIPSCTRAPLNGSRLGNTVLVMFAMQHYATKQQRPDVEQAARRAEAWLVKAPLRDTDDLAWRLWGLDLLEIEKETKEAKQADVRSALLRAQNEDGGWSQTSQLASDAYATGEALYILLRTGLPPDDRAARRAAAYLVRTQEPDGSWLVKSRLKSKAQPYFDNGDPHGEHQFLSVAGTSWATAALFRMCSPRLRPTFGFSAQPRP